MSKDWTRKAIICVAGLLSSLAAQAAPQVIHMPVTSIEAVDKVPELFGQQGGTFTTPISRQLQTFHPFLADDIYTKIVINNLLSSLVRLNPVRNEPTPALAYKWELSPDELTYTFYLREGIRWSDGRPLTSDDVIFTFVAIFDGRYPNRLKQKFTYEGVPIVYSKINDHTFILKTPKPYVPLLVDLFDLNILPKHVLYSSFNDGTFLKQFSLEQSQVEPQRIVSSGPFVLDNYMLGEKVVLKANPYYWRVDEQGQRLPYIDYLIYQIVRDVNTEMVLFASGRSDLTSSSILGGDVDWLESIAPKQHLRIFSRGLSNSSRFLWFNLNPGSNAKGQPFVAPHKLKWFEDKRFRQAIAHGMNRQGMIEALYQGRGKPQLSIISEANEKWFDPSVRQYDYDPIAAKKLLEEMGFSWNSENQLMDTNGNKVAFELITFEGENILAIFKENMQALGIEVKITPLDLFTFLHKINQTYQYEAAFIKFVPDSDDPSAYTPIFKSSGHLHYWYPNQIYPKYPWEKIINELVEAQEVAFDLQKRIERVHQLQEIFMEELPLIPLITPEAFIGVADKWQNLQIQPIGIALWNIDEIWDSTIK